MAKSPKAFNRLYVNMIKAGEAGGALEIILKRLAEFQERSESLKRKVKGALIYPVVVITIASGLLVFIMSWIVPKFEAIFKDFKADLPDMTKVLIAVSYGIINYWYLLPGIPLTIWLILKLIRKFRGGRMGWHLFLLKMPIFGQLVEKNIVARTMRTLGTLVASGVPILEALHITKETSGNAVFEGIFQKVYEAIREGESIAKPMKENSRPSFHPMALFFWFFWPPVIGALLVPDKNESARLRRHGHQHGRRRRGDGRTRYDALQGRRHLRRGSRRVDRRADAIDGAFDDPDPRRHGRLHRHRLVLAVDLADRQTQQPLVLEIEKPLAASQWK